MKALLQWCRDCAAATASFLCPECGQWRCAEHEARALDGITVCTRCYPRAGTI